MTAFAQDLRIAARGLLRIPGFTLVTAGVLALGIGANTAIFSVVHAVLLRPLPYPEADRVMQIRQVNGDGGTQIALSYPNYADLRAASRSFQEMGAYAAWTATVSAEGEALRTAAAGVTAGFFEVLGVQPFLGRAFLAEEVGVPGSSAVVVGHDYWRTRLGGERDLSRAAVRLGDRAYTVVGVMPQGFSFPAGAELWLPSDASADNQTRTGHNFQVVGRLRDDVTLEGARAELSGIARRLKARYGDDTWMSDATLVSLQEQLVGRLRSTLMILLGAAGFLLLIACANVMNLLLARAVSRRREVAIRVALGAGRGRMAAQFLAEAVVLAALGGAGGIILAYWGVPALLAFEPGGLPRLDEVGVDRTVLLFAVGVSAVTAVAMGLVPALQRRGGDVRTALSDGPSTGAGGRSGSRARRLLAVSQIALSVVLLVGAGLLGRSFVRLLEVDPGYRTGDAVVMDLWVPRAEGDAAMARLGLFHQQLVERLGAVPGLEEVGGVNAFPLSGGGGNGTFVILDDPAEVAGLRSFEQLMAEPALLRRFQDMLQDPLRTGYAEFRIASDGYFRAMEIPLERGRLFEEGDGPDAPHVAVISRSLAETRWPGEDPLGKLVEFGNMDGDLRPFTVVGIVGDVRERSLEAEPRPTFYGYARQRPRSTFDYHVVMRGSAEPASLVASARTIVAELNPDVAVRFRTLDQVFSASLAERRFSLLLLGVFGVVALLLAMMGIYGTIAYLMSRRTREIGIRMALGATGGAVRRMVVRQGLLLAVIGVAVGLVVARGLAGVVESVLWGVTTADPLTYGGAALVLVLVVVGASWGPAARAAAVEPRWALNSD